MTICIISGNLTKDPETGVTKNNRPWANFTVAVSRPAKNPETDKYDITDYFSCSVFGNQADWISRCSKGDPVVVKGRMQQDKYKDKDGVEHRPWILMVDDLVTPKKKSSGDDEAEAETKPSKPKKRPELQPFDDDGDIPF